MGRFVNPSPQWVDSDGTVLSGGKLYFYTTATTNAKDTYSDAALSTANANPVILDTAGTAPDIFLAEDESYKLIIQRSDGTQFASIDPVGVAAETGAFSDWSSLTTYNIPDLVTGSDNLHYRSIADTNLNNDPISDATKWSQVKLTTIYNANETYAATDRVISAGIEYQSRVGSNTGNTPVSSTTEWANTDEVSGDPSPTLGAALTTSGFDIVMTSGDGLDFAATANADGTGATMTNELFDDYEEGTWTPVLSDGTNTATHSTQIGNYTKIGNVVRINCVVVISSLTGSGTVSGNIQIDGLPFTPASTSGGHAVTCGRATGLAITASENISGYIEESSGTFFLFAWDDAAGTTQMTSTQMSANGGLYLAGTYRAA